MKTKEQVLKEVEEKVLVSECVDKRDFSRLIYFYEIEEWEKFGMEIREDADTSNVIIKEWTELNITTQLVSDAEFGLEKGLDQRGISTFFMFAVCNMWLDILEDELQCDDYTGYAVPFFRSIIKKYKRS